VLGVESDSLDVRWSFQADDEDDRRSLKLKAINIKTPETTKSLESTADVLELLPHTAEAQAARPLVDLLRQTVFVSAVRQTDTEVYLVRMIRSRLTQTWARLASMPHGGCTKTMILRLTQHDPRKDPASP